MLACAFAAARHNFVAGRCPTFNITVMVGKVITENI